MHPAFHLSILVPLAWLAAIAGCGQPQSVAQTQSASPVASPSAPDPPNTSEESAADQASITEKPSAPAAPPSPAPAETAKGQRPPADRSATRPGDAEKITFDDLNLGMQADIVFREFMVSDRVHELEGKRISIVGYMHPAETQRGIKKFILLKNTQCKFGKGGQADHLADINLRADKSTVFTNNPLKVEGTLKLAPFQGPDGNTWSIYRLEDAQIR